MYDTPLVSIHKYNTLILNFVNYSSLAPAGYNIVHAGLNHY
jgi:hypothetical protein